MRKARFSEEQMVMILREADKAPVVSAMRELSAQYPRFGYRRIHVFLGRRGHEMNTDRSHRLWRPGGPASTAQAASTTDFNGPLAAIAADADKLSLGLRLRV